MNLMLAYHAKYSAETPPVLPGSVRRAIKEFVSSARGHERKERLRDNLVKSRGDRVSSAAVSSSRVSHAQEQKAPVREWLRNNLVESRGHTVSAADLWTRFVADGENVRLGVQSQKQLTTLAKLDFQYKPSSSKKRHFVNVRFATGDTDTRDRGSDEASEIRNEAREEARRESAQ
jgi:hypothetical protein